MVNSEQRMVNGEYRTWLILLVLRPPSRPRKVMGRGAGHVRAGRRWVGLCACTIHAPPLCHGSPHNNYSPRVISTFSCKVQNKRRIDLGSSKSHFCEMAATFLLYLVGCLTAYLAYEAGLKPPKNRRLRFKYRMGMVACLIVGLGLTIYQCLETQRTESKNKQRIAELTNKLDDVHNSQTTLLSQYSKLYDQHQKLKDILIQSQSLDPAVRQQILDASKEFEPVSRDDEDVRAWEERLKTRIKRLKQSEQVAKDEQRKQDEEENQKAWEDRSPIYLYTVHTLTELLVKASTSRNDQIVSNFKSLPSYVPLESGYFDIAEIKFQTNADWNFRVISCAFGQSFGTSKQRDMIIQSRNCAARICLPEGGIVSEIHIKGLDQPIRDSGSSENYKPMIKNIIEQMIGAEAESVAAINK